MATRLSYWVSEEVYIVEPCHGMECLTSPINQNLMQSGTFQDRYEDMKTPDEIWFSWFPDAV